MKLVVDGVFFQLSRGGIARVWSSLLPRLADISELEIVLLDRGNAPIVSKVEIIPHPLYKMESGTAADSALLEKTCQALGADVFASTYYTTPLTIPSMLMVYDMIPEVLGFDLTLRPWLEKEIAISFATSYACISEQTKSELSKFYPATAPYSSVAYCGVDRNIFYPRQRHEIAAFKNLFRIERPYYLIVGAREQHRNYKNQVLTFNAAKGMKENFDLLCVGGEQLISQEMLNGLPLGITAKRVDLSDDQLAAAYSGAEALIYPSLYEGFGMPVAEAMACKCLAITTPYGSLSEVAGDAAVFVTGHDVDELQRAMLEVRKSETKTQLQDRGLKQSAKFSWEAMATTVYEQLKLAVRKGSNPERRAFYQRWRTLRTVQAEVDPT